MCLDLFAGRVDFPALVEYHGQFDSRHALLIVQRRNQPIQLIPDSGTVYSTTRMGMPAYVVRNEPSSSTCPTGNAARYWATS